MSAAAPQLLLALCSWLPTSRVPAHAHAVRTPTMLAPEDALTVLSLPTEPSPALSPIDVVHTLCRGLQNNNVPSENDGLRRLYAFTSYECKASLTSRKGFFSGVEKFVEHAEVYTLKGCLSFALVGEPTIIAGTQTRGAIATLSVDVSEALSFRGPSGFERTKPDGEP